MKVSKYLSVALVATLLTGCGGEGWNNMSPPTGCALLGAAGGVMVGSAVGRNSNATAAAVGIGAVAGALIGYAIGEIYDLSKSDNH